MNRAALGLIVLCAACSPSVEPAVEPSPDASVAEPSPDAGMPAAPIALEALEARVADALCGALERCCDGESRRRFFAEVAQSQRLSAALRAELGADGGVPPERCRALVAQAWNVTPLGPWVRAAQDGLVTYEPAAARACVEALDQAACGAPVTAALHDTRCFAFAAPAGGDEQRRAFTRSASSGACRALADGFGGTFFGTCDPRVAFCCGTRADGSCGVVGQGAGVCRPASQLGQPCGVAPLAVCATGLECDLDSSVCVAPVTTPLPHGAVCVMGTALLGTCVDGWCDLGGTDRCQPRAALGASCGGPWECVSGACEGGRCVEPRTCVGL